MKKLTLLLGLLSITCLAAPGTEVIKIPVCGYRCEWIIEGYGGQWVEFNSCRNKANCELPKLNNNYCFATRWGHLPVPRYGLCRKPKEQFTDAPQPEYDVQYKEDNEHWSSPDTQEY